MFRNLKIKTKIFIWFLVTILLIIAVGYFLVADLAQETLKKSIGENSVMLTQEILDKIDRSIYYKIERWLSYIHTNSRLYETVTGSNQEFENIENRQEYIDKIDKDWKEGKDVKLIQEILNNELSKRLKKRTEFYREKDGYNVFPEVFVTNKYGAIIASTGKTSDYRQDDEEWWQNAKKDSLYVEDLKYDESAEVYSIAICMAAEDEQGNFSGVIKIILNIEEVVNILKEFEPTGERKIYGHEEHKTMEFKLLTKDGKIIYSTEEFKILDNISEELLSQFERGKIGEHIDYFIAGGDKPGEGEELFAHAHSIGYREYKGLEWILVIEHKTKEIFISVVALRNTIIITISIVAILFAMLSFLVSYFITKSIKNLSQTVQFIIRGDLTKRAEVKSKDEIGQLAQNFNVMTESLIRANQKIKKYAVTLEDKVEERTIKLAETLSEVNREKDRINTILQSIGDGVFVINKDFKITMFNRVAENISGFSEKEVIGKKYSEVLKFVFENSGKINDGFIKKAMNTGEVKELSNHAVLIRKDGKKIAVADSAAPLRNENGRIVGCVVVFRDVSRERRISQMESEFVSIASHQLRTPITAIQWLMERVLRKEKISKKGREYLDDVHASARRLNALVDLLLNVSKVEAGKISVSFRKTEVIETIDRYLKESKELCAEKNITLTFKEHPKALNVVTDNNLFSNILQSLVSNAIEYTSEKGKIEVSLEKKPKSFVLVVSDTGIGIPEKEQATIFDKFTRASNAKLLKTDGTGLGLYFTKQIVGLLGGKIWLKSTKDKGATFYVELPLNSKTKVKSVN